MPLVSIITPVCNASRWIPDVLTSVWKQTFADWEHLLVDDASTDSSTEMIEAAAERDVRIVLVRMSRNSCPSAARSRALDAARGRYIAFLDADDLWLPEKLSRSISCMQANGYAFLYHDYRFMSYDGQRVGPLVVAPEVLDFRALHTQRGFGCLSIVLDREQLPDFRFPTDHAFLHEDFCAWLRVVQDGHIGHPLHADLARYRLSAQSRSGNKLHAARETWKIYRQFSGLSLPRATGWWLQYAWNGFWLHHSARPR